MTPVEDSFPHISKLLQLARQTLCVEDCEALECGLDVYCLVSNEEETIDCPWEFARFVIQDTRFVDALPLEWEADRSSLFFSAVIEFVEPLMSHS